MRMLYHTQDRSNRYNQLSYRRRLVPMSRIMRIVHKTSTLATRSLQHHSSLWPVRITTPLGHSACYSCWLESSHPIPAATHFPCHDTPFDGPIVTPCGPRPSSRHGRVECVALDSVTGCRRRGRESRLSQPARAQYRSHTAHQSSRTWRASVVQQLAIDRVVHQHSVFGR